MKRRDLIRNIAAGTATVFILPTVLTSCEEEMPEPDNGDPSGDTLLIDLSEEKYSALAAAGGSAIVENIIVINTGEEFIALSSVCTHQGCSVSYDHGEGNLPCPCHGSLFSTSGAVLSGPASSALKKYSLTREGDLLIIDLD